MDRGTADKEKSLWNHIAGAIKVEYTFKKEGARYDFFRVYTEAD